MIDAFEVRMALESFAMERAVRTLTKEKRAELRKACETMHATPRRPPRPGATAPPAARCTTRSRNSRPVWPLSI